MIKSLIVFPIYTSYSSFRSLRLCLSFSILSILSFLINPTTLILYNLTPLIINYSSKRWEDHHVWIRKLGSRKVHGLQRKIKSSLIISINMVMETGELFPRMLVLIYIFVIAFYLILLFIFV